MDWMLHCRGDLHPNPCQENMQKVLVGNFKKGLFGRSKAMDYSTVQLVAIVCPKSIPVIETNL